MDSISEFTAPSPENLIDALPSFVVYTNRNLEVRLANTSFIRHLNQSYPQIASRSDIIGHSLLEITADKPWEDKLSLAVKQVTTSGQPASIEHPDFDNPDRTLGWMVLPVSDPVDNHIIGFTFHGTDITQKVAERERLQREAIYDPLTGLYNRNFFENYLQMLSGGHFSLGLINLDADGLKKINDTQGHKAGDRYLQNIGKILKQSFRDTDIVARMGDKGDEFNIIVFSENLTQAAVENRLLILQENIDNFNAANPHNPIRLSFGYSFVPRNVFNTRDNDYNRSLIDQARKTADERMYQHKNQKKEAQKHPFRKPHPKKKYPGRPQYPEDYSI